MNSAIGSHPMRIGGSFSQVYKTVHSSSPAKNVGGGISSSKNLVKRKRSQTPKVANSIAANRSIKKRKVAPLYAIAPRYALALSKKKGVKSKKRSKPRRKGFGRVQKTKKGTKVGKKRRRKKVVKRQNRRKFSKKPNRVRKKVKKRSGKKKSILD